MKFTVADLLNQLSLSNPLPLAKLEKALALTTTTQKQHLRIALDGLVRLGLIEESEAGLCRLDRPDLVTARLRCSSKGFCFALREDGGEDIYIRDHQLNHAWNGDQVLVKITREGGDVALRRGCSASWSATPRACWPRWRGTPISCWPCPSTTVF